MSELVGVACSCGRQRTVVPLMAVEDADQSLDAGGSSKDNEDCGLGRDHTSSCTLDAGGSSKDNEDCGLDHDHTTRRTLSLRRRLLTADADQLTNHQVVVAWPFYRATLC